MLLCDTGVLLATGNVKDHYHAARLSLMRAAERPVPMPPTEQRSASTYLIGCRTAAAKAPTKQANPTWCSHRTGSAATSGAEPSRNPGANANRHGGRSSRRALALTRWHPGAARWPADTGGHVDLLVTTAHGGNPQDGSGTRRLSYPSLANSLPLAGAHFPVELDTDQPGAGRRLPSYGESIEPQVRLPNIEPGDRPPDDHPLDLRRALEDSEDLGGRGSFSRSAACEAPWYQHGFSPPCLR
jgi:hypothetical protein